MGRVRGDDEGAGCRQCNENRLLRCPRIREPDRGVLIHVVRNNDGARTKVRVFATTQSLSRGEMKRLHKPFNRGIWGRATR